MENIYTYIIRFRTKQIYRFLSDAGFGLIAIAIILTIGVTIPFFQRILSLPSYISLVGLTILLFLIHQKRSDGEFLKTILASKKEFINLHLVEYSLISLPFSIFQLCKGQYLTTIGLILIPFIISQIPQFRNSTTNRKPFKFNIIPFFLFEVKYALERRWLTYSLAYLASYLVFIHVAFILLSILVYCLLILESFSENESREMISFTENFVWTKWLSYAKLTIVYYLVPLSIGFITYPEQGLLFIYLFAFMLVHLFMVISYKYSNYNPLFKIQGSSNALAIVFTMSLFPGAILISFSFGVYHYFRAQKHLKKIYA